MKEIKLVIRIDEETGKIAVARQFTGYAQNNINHQLELLGIYQNLAILQQQKLENNKSDDN